MAKLNLAVHCSIKRGLNNGWHGFGNESSLHDQFVSVMKKDALNLNLNFVMLSPT